MCLSLPVHDRCLIWPVPGRLNCAQYGFGHENRVYLSGAGVVSIIVVLLWQGMDQKIQSRRQLCHVTVLQDYPIFTKGRNAKDIQAKEIYLFASGDPKAADFHLSALSIKATQGGNDIIFKDDKTIGTMQSLVG